MDIPVPEDRPVRTREATRVVMICDGASGPEVLLFEDSDPGIADVRWWVTPGGGIDPGEDERAAGVREIQEETGWRITRDELIGPLAVRVAVHGYSDQILRQRETFFAVRTPKFDVDTSGHTPDEQITLQSWRWWPLADLGASGAWVWPSYLADLVTAAETLAPQRVDRGVEFHESTVEIGEQQRRQLM